MRKLIPAAILTATALALSTTAAFTASAQSAQERIDRDNTIALADGYLALMLCGALANAERNGAERSIEHVFEWELKGIYPDFDEFIPDDAVGFGVYNRPDGRLDRIVAGDRVAYNEPGRGCSIQPMGSYYPRTGRWSAPVEIPSEAEPLPENPEALAGESREALLKRAFGGTYGEGSRTSAVVLLKGGAIIAEQYADGFGPNVPQRTWSVAKSIAATLVGGAVMRGEIDANQSAGLGSGPGDPRSQITLDHLLRMASGRYSDTPGNRTDPVYWGGATVTERASHWPMLRAPGSVYRYANNDTLMATQAISASFKHHSPAAMFAAIGMTHTVAETDWEGNYVLSSQVWSTARDLARLGQLYLNDGTWGDEQIFRTDWREYVSTPSGPQPEGTNWGYGAGWWTFSRPEGNAFEGIPDDAFAARGNRGQYVVVVPSRNVVIVRRGEDMVGTRFDIAAFTRDVLAALEE